MKTIALFALTFISTASLQAMQEIEEPISPEFSYFDKIKKERDSSAYDKGIGTDSITVSARHIPSMRIYSVTYGGTFSVGRPMEGFSYQEKLGQHIKTSLDKQVAEKIYSRLLIAHYVLTPDAAKKRALDELHKLVKDSAKKDSCKESDLGFLSAAG